MICVVLSLIIISIVILYNYMPDKTVNIEGVEYRLGDEDTPYYKMYKVNSNDTILYNSSNKIVLIYNSKNYEK